MLNFNYSIPTKVFFGKDKINELGEQIKIYGTNVLMVYGGGSIKRNRIYNKVIEIFEENNINYWELPGVEPNPRIETVKKGADICKENAIDIVLAVGGGSTIDCSKVIAAARYYDGCPWDLVTNPEKITKVTPIGTILTLAATGSEMDAGAVITNLKTNEKLGTGHPHMAPKFSILDPTYTFSVSKYQTAAGTADIISHVFEEYFQNTQGAYLQDRLAEAILKTCINYGEIALDEPENYEARANLMWSSSLAINNLLAYGKNSDWSVHPIEHELSAFYDITHGVGLAILTPHWMRFVLNENTLEKFVEYGVNVWAIDDKLSKDEIANKAIDMTSEYFASLGIPMKLSEVGIEKEKLELMANQAARFGDVGNFVPLNAADILKIYEAAY